MARRLHFGIGMQINGNETLSSAQTYDVVILGGGTGSTVAAWTFASQAQRVAVIEVDHARTSPACRARTFFKAPGWRRIFVEEKSSACSRTASGLTCRQCSRENAPWYRA
jgi:choline dehydrogenase-like flavoprotein